MFEKITQTMALQLGVAPCPWTHGVMERFRLDLTNFTITTQQNESKQKERESNGEKAIQMCLGQTLFYFFLHNSALYERRILCLSTCQSLCLRNSVV